MTRKNFRSDPPLKSVVLNSTLKAGCVNVQAADFSETATQKDSELAQEVAPLQNGLWSGYKILSNTAPKGSLCFKPLL